MKLSNWFLTAEERGNPSTVLDRRHGSGEAWTIGNDVQPLVHGAVYFTELLAAVRLLQPGDLLLFTDWRGDPDELLNDPGTQVSRVLCQAAATGVVVRGLVWRSHLDRLQFSERENRHLGEDIDAAGGICLLDMRVRPGGSHHQKFVVLRHPGRPELDVAFVGGIDLCHSRRDDSEHLGDHQAQPMAAVYGDRPPWHDVQVAVRGPAVGDFETVFRERWQDPSPLSRNPFHRLRDRLQRVDMKPSRLPEQLPDPAPRGPSAVQLLRTYPPRRPGYPFAPAGERSIARGIDKAVSRAEHLIYLENQYLWSRDVAAGFCAALKANPTLLLIAVVPLHPDQDGRFAQPPNLVGRNQALRMLQRAGGDRVSVYGLENHHGTPVYVHAKVCIIDDTWASVGSDNLNRRSWTYDSELSCAVVSQAVPSEPVPSEPVPSEPVPSETVQTEPVPNEPGPGRPYAQQLRLLLFREHLDRPDGDDRDLVEPGAAYNAFVLAADTLDRWHATGGGGPRPPGRLRRYHAPSLSPLTSAWAAPLYRLVYDPDGRPRSVRRRGQF